MSVESSAFATAVEGAHAGGLVTGTYVLAAAIDRTTPARVLHSADVRGLWDEELPALAVVTHTYPRPRFAALCLTLGTASPLWGQVAAFLSTARLECSRHEVYLEDVALLASDGTLVAVIDPDTGRPVPNRTQGPR